MYDTAKRLAAVVLAAGLSMAAVSDRTVQLNRGMRDKLTYSQRVLEAVVTSNWSELEENGRALQRATADPAWSVLATAEYARHTAAFTRATEDLLEAARARDLDAASLAYVSLTLSCVQCHRYFARARIAR